jgi:hypothetical protein
MANTRPSWIDDNEGDEPGTDPAMLAEFERALGARGYSLDGQQGGGASGPTSNAAIDPGSQPEGANAGDASTSANAPVDTPPTPGTGGAVAPGGEAPQTLPPPEAGTEAPPSEPQVFQVTTPSGDVVQVTPDQINYMIQLHNWISAKDQAIKDQWRDIETGTHTTISKEDKAAYDAWVQAGRPTQTQPGIQRPQFDTSFMDEKAIAYIADLEAKVKESGVPHSTVPTPAPAAPPSMTEQDMQARATVLANQRVQLQQALDQSQAAIRDKYALTPELVTRLNQATTDLNVIPGLVEKHRTRSPLGDLISDAPMGTVFTEAMEIAMSTDPVLKASYEQYIVNQHLAANNATLQAVGAKKANAASLASAPSASVPGTEVDPRKMTAQQRHDAMVAELAEHWQQ